MIFNPLSANFTKWSNTLKQFVGNFLTNCLSVFGHFVGLALKRLTKFFFVLINLFLKIEPNQKKNKSVNKSKNSKEN